jgi:hypothetical protein
MLRRKTAAVSRYNDRERAIAGTTKRFPMPVAMPQSDEAVLARRAEIVAARLQPVAPMVSRRQSGRTWKVPLTLLARAGEMIGYLITHLTRLPPSRAVAKRRFGSQAGMTGFGFGCLFLPRRQPLSWLLREHSVD